MPPLVGCLTSGELQERGDRPSAGTVPKGLEAWARVVPLRQRKTGSPGLSLVPRSFDRIEGWVSSDRAPPELLRDKNSHTLPGPLH